MAKGPEEWFQQAQYDLRTAEAMFEQQMKKDYRKLRTEHLLVKSKGVLKWLKKELRK